MSKKACDVILYTNAPLEINDALFEGYGVLCCHANDGNSISTNLCTATRRAICDQKKQCGDYQPVCEADKAVLLNIDYLKYSLATWQQREKWDKKIGPILRKWWKKCRPVNVHIRETIGRMT